jgi:hypothetical protein
VFIRTARAIGILHFTWLETSLSRERSLLVARIPAIQNAFSAGIVVRHTLRCWTSQREAEFRELQRF